MGSCLCCSRAHDRPIGYMLFASTPENILYPKTANEPNYSFSTEALDTHPLPSKVALTIVQGTEKKPPVNDSEDSACSTDIVTHRSSSFFSPQVDANYVCEIVGQHSQVLSYNSSTNEPWSSKSQIVHSFLSPCKSDSVATQLILALANIPLLKSSSEPVPRFESPWSISSLFPLSGEDDLDNTEELEMDNLPHPLLYSSIPDKRDGAQSGLLKRQVASPEFENFVKSIEDIDLQLTSMGESLTKLLLSMEERRFKNDDEKVLSPLGSYRSQLAYEIESNFCPNEGRCYGIMSWDLCWLRGDGEDNHADYHETICIAERLLSPHHKSEALKYRLPSQKYMRTLKKALADAYIEAVPSSRRKVSLVTIAVDSIWKEVTSITKGSLVLQKDLYMKELAWLRARKKKTETENGVKSLLRQSTNRAKFILYDKAGVQTPSS